MFEGKRLFLTSLKQTCNEYLIKFSENQSAPKLENRKTSPCFPCAPNLLHVLVSWIPGYHNLCSPAQWSERNIICCTSLLSVGVEFYTYSAQFYIWLHPHSLCLVSTFQSLIYDLNKKETSYKKFFF